MPDVHHAACPCCADPCPRPSFQYYPSPDPCHKILMTSLPATAHVCYSHEMNSLSPRGTEMCRNDPNRRKTLEKD